MVGRCSRMTTGARGSLVAGSGLTRAPAVSAIDLGDAELAAEFPPAAVGHRREPALDVARVGRDLRAFSDQRLQPQDLLLRLAQLAFQADDLTLEARTVTLG